MTLSSSQVEQFVSEGFVRIENAFPGDMAKAARECLWRASNCDPDDRRTWTKPVVRLGGHDDPPFVAAANTPTLRAAFDALAGAGRWVARDTLGGFVLRFPSPETPGDTGWHIDSSFPPDVSRRTDYLDWRVNLASRDRALLMLFLFTDVGENDAPTRIAAGSHLGMARVLEPFGEDGVAVLSLARRGVFDKLAAGRRETLATGPAGTVYLCHPFLIHAAQEMRNGHPRFLGQPPLHPRTPVMLERPDGDYSPVERAIRLGLGR